MGAWEYRGNCSGGCGRGKGETVNACASMSIKKLSRVLGTRAVSFASMGWASLYEGIRVLPILFLSRGEGQQPRCCSKSVCLFPWAKPVLDSEAQGHTVWSYRCFLDPHTLSQSLKIAIACRWIGLISLVSCCRFMPMLQLCFAVVINTQSDKHTSSYNRLEGL